MTLCALCAVHKLNIARRTDSPPISGMECDVDRIVSYVSCYSSTMGTREEAGNLFTRFVDELQSTLLSDRWRKVKEEPRINSIRSYTYADQESDAHIDIDLIALSDSYIVTIFGWRADLSSSARGVISQDATTDGSYCHTKFEAIRE